MFQKYSHQKLVLKFVLKFLYNSFFHKSLEDDTLSQKVVERIKLSKVFHLFVAIAASWDKRSPGAAEQYKSNGKSIIYHRDLLDINLAMTLHLLHLDTPHFCEWSNECRYMVQCLLHPPTTTDLCLVVFLLFLCCRCKFFYHRADSISKMLFLVSKSGLG